MNLSAEDKLKLRLVALETLKKASETQTQTWVARRLRIAISQVNRYVTRETATPNIERSLKILKLFKAYIPNEILIDPEWITKAIEAAEAKQG